MKAMDKNNVPDSELNNNFDALCQEFDGVTFYGLEYILEDFFQSMQVKSKASTHSSVDWFGLYD